MPDFLRTQPASRDGAAEKGPAAQPADGGNAVTRDQNARDGLRAGLMDYLRHAQNKSGRRPTELVREFLRLYRGSGRLSWAEYVQYGVYDTSRYSPEEQSRFISNARHWPITHRCCDMTWQATTEDKWLCSHILARSNIRVPRTLAVIDRTTRHYPETRKISTATELRDFMTSPDALPLFGKENRGICSYGAFLAEAADDTGIVLRGHGRVSYDACMDGLAGEAAYLLQPVETNHEFFARYADSLATVRVCILIDGDAIRIPFAVLKLPARDNIADSFWRPGNLACDLDVATGCIRTVRSKDALGTTDYDNHPETGAPLLGETLPMWDRVIDLAHRCAPIFHPVRYQSMDIAITPQEPVLIEINTGGGFDLPQLASGRGFLTDEVRSFFRTCGCRGF